MVTPCLQVRAPAKINLGLEILGKRPDGFHEIRSILAMLELSDTIRLHIDDAGSGTDLPGVPAGENLIARALSAFAVAVSDAPALGWSLTKRIPAAAGLGGASADAAAALLAANTLSGNPLEKDDLDRIAAALGSDIPFFLGPPTAFASGRGTELAPLPPIDEPVAILLPRAAIADKTRTLYAMIEPSDLSGGARSKRAMTAIENGRLPGPEDLRNAFSRPLAHLVPDILDLGQEVRSAGVRHVALSGAGPAHYIIGKEGCAALAQSDLLDKWLGRIDVIWTRTRLTRPCVVPCDDG